MEIIESPFQFRRVAPTGFNWLDEYTINMWGEEALAEIVELWGYSPPYLVTDVVVHKQDVSFQMDKRLDLLTDFASLSGEPDGILEFANKNGSLFSYDQWIPLPKGSTIPLPLNFEFGDLKITHSPHTTPKGEFIESLTSAGSIWFWREHIWWMGVLLQIWEWLKGGDVRSLKEHIKWKTSKNYREKVAYLFPISGNKSIPESFKAELSDENLEEGWRLGLEPYMGYPETAERGILIKTKAKPGELLEAARDLLRQSTNEAFDNNPLLPFVHLEEKESRLLFCPSSLLGAMWLQFAELITGGHRIIRCEYCKKWMDVTDNSVNIRMHPDCANRNRVQRHRRDKRLVGLVESMRAVPWNKRLEQWNLKYPGDLYDSIDSMKRDYKKAKGDIK